ncbi:MAG TPA: methyltransferase domain-containing protein [Candidatus Acidoferrales bacterium]|jgi:putative heme-binding domain-containing protein|nr:methyltransferase domain-containing protein [Candidatus Acidoferrales bacterium]
MNVARGAMWGSLASCGGLAIRPPGVGAQPNFHERLSRVRRIGNPPAGVERSPRRLGLAALLVLPAVLIAQSSAGKAVFEGKGGCLRCHSIADHGGALGPDLTEIGLKRTLESLRLSITDPDAEIYREYLTVVVTTKQGQRIEGIGLNEDDLSIQLRDPEGNPRSFLKENLKEVRREERSLMPSYSAKLSAREIDSLVEYLRSLRGSVEALPQTRKAGPLTRNTDWLTRANRDAQERPEMLLDNLQISPGDTVADLGAGAGYFTWRLAQRVGARGKVIAVDVQPTMLELVARDVKRRGLTNVAVVLGGESDPRLPEAAVDLVFIANAYHEFSQPEPMMAAVRRSLKPHGRVVVIEYAEENTDDPVAGLYTMSLPEIRSEMEVAGFQLDRVLDFLPMQHGLVFTPRPQNTGGK